MRPELVDQALARFNVVDIAHLPTPLEAMPRLGAYCNNEQMYVKRDDCTGLGLGGNKVRQIRFYYGDAIAKGADTILITGARQSNYNRTAAAAAAKLGLACHVQLEHRVEREDYAYQHSGNVLLDNMFGATVHHYPDGEDEVGADRELETIAATLKAEGANPYVIHLSQGHAPIGALGYVEAAGELLRQIQQQNIQIDEIVVASGSAHTHAGLLTGLRVAQSDIRVTGICVRRSAELQIPRVLAKCHAIQALFDQRDQVTEDDVQVIDRFLAPGYGKLNDPTVEAMVQSARLEGLVVDPVYTAKSLAGAMHRARESGAATLFIHTGGTPGVFAYESDITPHVTSS